MLARSGGFVTSESRGDVDADHLLRLDPADTLSVSAQTREVLALTTVRETVRLDATAIARAGFAKV